jgi:hypothetical protein
MGIGVQISFVGLPASMTVLLSTEGQPVCASRRWTMSDPHRTIHLAMNLGSALLNVQNMTRMKPIR